MPFKKKKKKFAQHTLPSFWKPGLQLSSVSVCFSELLLIRAGYLCLLLTLKRQDSELSFKNDKTQAARLQAS